MTTKTIVFGQQGGLLEIGYAGAGFLLVRRNVYQTVQEQLKLPVCNERFGRPMVPYFQPIVRNDEDGHWYLPEDYAFCERARQCGFQVIADTTIRLHHFGGYGYTWEDAGSPKARYVTYNFHLTDEPGPKPPA